MNVGEIKNSPHSAKTRLSELFEQNIMKIVLLVVAFFSVTVTCRRHAHSDIRFESNKPVVRIVDGHVTSIEKYPFVVTLMSRHEKHGRLQFGASIIHNYWAVTAAHFVAQMPDRILRPESFILRGNTSYINGPTGNNHHIIDLKYHETYIILEGNINDVALLKVKQPFSGVNEAPIPIAPQNYQYKVGTTALIFGWGYIDTNVNQLSVQLRVSDITLSDMKTCKSVYTWFNYLNAGILNIYVTNTTICAMSHKRGHCVGDNGGPVVQNGMLIGILSIRADCASARFPYVFTKISAFRDWILKNVK